MSTDDLFPLARFEDLVADALDSLPDFLGERMENVVVVVSDEPAGDLYGLYAGIPLTKRADYGWMAMPDRVTIYRRTILRDWWTEDEILEQIRRTVIHEVAHHFGIEDKDLPEKWR